MTIICYSRGR